LLGRRGRHFGADCDRLHPQAAADSLRIKASN
jgi:hypothetical protein